MQNHQPQRAAANYGHCIAGTRARVLKSMHCASQRFGQRRVLQRNVIRHVKRILGHDAGRDAYELGIGAVVEEQIVAEVFLLPFAVAFGGLSVGACVAMMVFLLLLVEGLVWAWQKGVLTWK